MRGKGCIAIALTGALSAACVPPPGPRPPSYQADARVLRLNPIVIFQSSAGPVSQQTSTLADVHGAMPTRRVQGEECQHGIQIPIGALVGSGSLYLSAGWGQGGYLKALARAEERAEGGHLVDVKVDLRTISVLLGVYVEQCVVVDAGVVPAAALVAPPLPGPTGPSAPAGPAAPAPPPPLPTETTPPPPAPNPIPADGDAGPSIQL